MTVQGKYIFMLSLHGLVRGTAPELGHDADTGGQVLYVLELARALGRHPDVERVDLLTRLVDDPAVAEDYRRPVEPLSERAQLVRLPFGPCRYIRKERLWPYLDQLVDRCLMYLRRQPRLPDLIHSHYADAGYVGRELSLLLGIPLVHTGHSLGRCKQARLLAAGRTEQALEREFRFARRIAAEEAVLGHASLVVTSTRQEAQEQYALYRNHCAARTQVIPPGTDAARFSPPGRRRLDPDVVHMVDRFFHEPDKPLILTVCRPDPRKNLRRLLAAYAGDEELKRRANLAIVAGNREDIALLNDTEQKVYQHLLLDIDRHDLYGRVAIPKTHTPDQVPELYRLAQRRRGVLVNAALTEPFGLTLIEAAASGLPVVATHDGGPKDIVGNCDNGLLIDPLDEKSIAGAIRRALDDAEAWRRWSRNGVRGVRRHYTWAAHVGRYTRSVERLLRRERKRLRRECEAHLPCPAEARRVLVSDIDNTLLGPGIDDLLRWLREQRGQVVFGVATGRSLPSTVKVLRQWAIPLPDVLVTAVGTEIYHGAGLRPDAAWARHIRWQWRRAALAETFARLPGLRPQAPDSQREFKLSYCVDGDRLPPPQAIEAELKRRGLQARLIYSHEAYLDVLPARASKGQALRYLAYRWALPLDAFLVAGDSGNDTEMLVGDTLAVVVGNYSAEMEQLRGLERIYFASAAGPRGILQGIAHYDFAGASGEDPRERAARRTGSRDQRIWP